MDKDYSGVSAYFDENPYASERDEPNPPDLIVEPADATVGVVGQTIVFEGRGGKGPYAWSVRNPDNGRVDVFGWSEGVYTCLRLGGNEVIVRDQDGHSAVARIRLVHAEMTLEPTAVTLSGGNVNAAFAVHGGSPPYSWLSGNPDMGTISYSAGSSHLARYTATPGVYGVNVITVQDNEQRSITATITQSE